MVTYFFMTRNSATRNYPVNTATINAPPPPKKKNKNIKIKLLNDFVCKHPSYFSVVVNGGKPDKEIVVK